MTTSVIAVTGTFSSSAVICAYAVLADPCPSSTFPVRSTIVLSGWISSHDAGSEGSSVVNVFAPFAAFAPMPEPTALSATTMPPAPLTNFERESVAPKMSIVFSSTALISRPLRHRLGRTLDRLEDRRVRPAAAEVAVHRLLDLQLRRILGRREQVCRLDDHSVLAVAALRHLRLDPRLLQRMQRGRSGRRTALLRPQRRQPLERRD